MVASQPGKVQTFDPAVSLSNFASGSRDRFLFNENQLVLAKVASPRPIIASAVRIRGTTTTTWDDYRNLNGEFVYIDGSYQALSTPGAPTGDVHRIVVGFDQSVTTDEFKFWSTAYVDTAVLDSEYSFDNVTWFTVGTVTWTQDFDDTIENFPGDSPPTGQYVYTGSFNGGNITARYWRMTANLGNLGDLTVTTAGQGDVDHFSLTVVDGSLLPTTGTILVARYDSPSYTFEREFVRSGNTLTFVETLPHSSTSNNPGWVLYYNTTYAQEKLNGVTEFQVIPSLVPVLQHWNSDGTQATTNQLDGDDYYDITYDKADDVYYAIRFNDTVNASAPATSDDFDALTGQEFDKSLWIESTAYPYFVHSDSAGTLDYKSSAGQGRLETTYTLSGDFQAEIEFVNLGKIENSSGYFSIDSKDADTGNTYTTAIAKGPFLDSNASNAGQVTMYDREVATTGWALKDKTTSILQISEDGTVGVSVSNGSIRIWEWDVSTLQWESVLWERPPGLMGAPTAWVDGFGAYPAGVAVSQKVVAVGDPGINAGAVFIYEKIGGVWSNTNSIDAPFTVSSSADFGRGLALHNGTLVVGAPKDTSVGAQAGSLHVYTGGGGTWTLQQSIDPSEVAGSLNVGELVRVDGDTIVASKRSGTSGPGLFVYLRTAGVWAEEQLISAPDESSIGWVSFGFRGDTIVAAGYDATNTKNDLVVYRRSGATWSTFQTISRTTLLDYEASWLDVNGSETIFTVAYSAKPSELYTYDSGSGQYEIIESLFPNSVHTDLARNTNTLVFTDSATYGSAYTYTKNEGSVWESTVSLGASDGNSAALYGTAVATSSGNAVVGAPHDRSAGVSAGAAYVLNNAGVVDWSEVMEITASGVVAGDLYGWSVAIHNEEVVIGAPGTVSGTGAVYIYEKDPGSLSWDFTQKIVASDGAVGDNFGWSVAVSEDKIVVGAYKDTNANGSEAGAVYFYTKSGGTWGSEEKELASDGAASDEFGYSVAMAADTAVVGARANEKAYVYKLSGIWAEEDTLAPSAPGGTLFGASVAVNGDTAVVGAPTDDTAGTVHGAFYIYTRSGVTWTEQQRVVPAGIAAGAELGISVGVTATSGTVVAGAPSEGAGSVYIYDGSGSVWSQVAKLTPSLERGYGTSVSVDINSLVIGAPIAPKPPRWQGAVVDYTDDIGSAASLANFRVNPAEFNFETSSTEVTILYNSTTEKYTVTVGGTLLGSEASPGTTYDSGAVSFVVSTLGTPADGQGYTVQVTSGSTEMVDLTTVSGAKLKVQRTGTNGYVYYTEPGGSQTQLFVANIDSSFAGRVQLHADSNFDTVNISADNFVASGGTVTYEAPVLSLMTVDKSGDVVQVLGLSDSDGYAIKALEIIGDFTAEYNDFLFPRVAVTTNGALAASAGAIYIKFNDRLLKYNKTDFPITTDDGIAAAVDTTGEIPETGIVGFAYNGYSQGGLSYIDYNGNLDGVFLWTVSDSTLLATDKRAELDVATENYPFAWNVTDLATLYYVDGTNLKLYDLNETKAAFVNLTSDKQVLAAGTAETATITAQVLNVYGEPKSNKSMTFTVSAGDGAISPAIGCSDVNGEDTTTYTVGSAVGTATITATVSDLTC